MFRQEWEETEPCRRTPAKVAGEVEEKQGRKAAGGIRKSYQEKVEIKRQQRDGQ